MKRTREEDDVGWDEAAGPVKQPRLFSDFQTSSFIRPLPVRVNSEPFPSSLSYRTSQDAGISDGSTNGSPVSMTSLEEMPDVDMDEDDQPSIVGSNSPPTPPPANRPAKLFPSPYRGTASIEDRLPTPTTHTFGPSGPSPIRAGTLGVLDGGRMHSPMAPPPIRRFANPREYPMPSPIRESLYSPARDSMQSPGVSPRTPSMLATQLQSPTAAAHDMSRLSVNGDGMDVEHQNNELESPTSVRMGRQRSGAMFSEKKRYHFGYLDNCEKCRNKVPGHHSHFIPFDA